MPISLSYGTGAAYVLDRGVECTLVNAATSAPSVAFSAIFSLYAVGWDHTVLFQAIGTFTVCTADLEISSDGGTTFVALVAANDFNASRTLKSLNLTPGNLYRWNVKTFTGTSVTINGTSS